MFAKARVVVTYVAGYQSGVLHLAMTMGRAVVTSDVGDLAAAVVDGETGLVVPAGDAAQLSEALARLAFDRELAERFGRNARDRVLAASGWDTVAASVEEALESIAERDRLARGGQRDSRPSASAISPRSARPGLVGRSRPAS